MAAIESFRSILNGKSDAYYQTQAAAYLGDYVNSVLNGVPYVGMSESRIGNTSLGTPSEKIRHNYECISGQQYIANLYDFCSGGRVVFTARCVNGKVTEVWDDRNNVYQPADYGSVPDDDDPYDASEYKTEDDFYDDHYDDFFDYEEAADYYRQHHG